MLLMLFHANQGPLHTYAPSAHPGERFATSISETQTTTVVGASATKSVIPQ
jgi:hypothetical protein